MCNFPDLYKSPRSFQEEFNTENGLYEHICVVCNEPFFGNKHRIVCKLCQASTRPKLNEPDNSVIVILQSMQTTIEELSSQLHSYPPSTNKEQIRSALVKTGFFVDVLRTELAKLRNVVGCLL